MSKVTLKVKGLKKLIKKVEGYPKELTSAIRREVDEMGADVVKYARQNHRFNTQSGNLEKSVSFKTYRRKNTQYVRFFLDDSIVTTENGGSYAVYIHEGTYQGYSRTPIAPLFNSSRSKSGNGWKGDPFLYNAIKEKWDINSALKHIAKDLKKQMEK